MTSSIAIVDLSSKPKKSSPGQDQISESHIFRGGTCRQRMRRESGISIPPPPAPDILEQCFIVCMQDETIGGCQTCTLTVKYKTRALTVRLIWKDGNNELDRSFPSFQPYQDGVNKQMLVVEGSSLNIVFIKFAQALIQSESFPSNS